MLFLDIVKLKYGTNFAPIGECCMVDAYSRCNLCNIPVVLLALAHWIQYETWSQMIIWNYENKRKQAGFPFFTTLIYMKKIQIISEPSIFLYVIGWRSIVIIWLIHIVYNHNIYYVFQTNVYSIQTFESW